MNKQKFIHGDLLNELKKLDSESIDCVITSPPYNLKSVVGGKSAISVSYNEYSDNKNNLEYEEWQIEILNELFRVIKDDGHIFYNHKPRYEKGEHIHPLTGILKSKPYFFQEIIWQTNRRVDNGGFRFTPQTERIYGLKKTKDNKNKLTKAFITSDLGELGRSENFNSHPAPFPLTLPQRILTALYGEESEDITVLDPFMGSGTVAKASMLLGMSSINIEMDLDYINKAQERLFLDESLNWEKERLNHIVKNPYKDKIK